MDLPHVALNRTTRRALLGGGAALLVSALARSSRAHNDAGVVDPPAPLPAIPLTLHDGSATTSSALLRGKITALQLMFTSCKASCPIQGALFARAARTLGNDVKDALWLSISVDPARDDPEALRRWLERFGAHPRWAAARPDPKALAGLVRLLKSQKPGPDPHTAQVYFVNREAALVMRSVDFPPAAELVRAMRRLGKA